MGYSKVNVHDLEPAGPGGVVRFVRRELDLLAFGINWFEIPPNGDGHQHSEARSACVRDQLVRNSAEWRRTPAQREESGQEEVNLIVRGSGRYVIDGEEVPIREGDVFRFDPETTRGPKAGPDGLTMVAVGAPRGSYEPRGSF